MFILSIQSYLSAASFYRVEEHQGNDSYVSLYSPEVTCFTIINQHTTHPSARLFGSNGSAGTCLSSLIFLLDFTHMGCLGFIIFSGFSEGGQCCFPIISLIDDGSSFFLHIIVLVYHDTGVLFIFFFKFLSILLEVFATFF